MFPSTDWEENMMLTQMFRGNLIMGPMVGLVMILAGISMHAATSPSIAAHSQKASVSLERVSVRLEELVAKDLAPIYFREQGLRLEVGKPFRNRKVTAFINDLSLEKALSSIADALYARWEKREDRLVLELAGPERTLLEALRNEEEGLVKAELNGVFQGCKRVLETALGNRVTPTNDALRRTLDRLRTTDVLEYVRVETLLAMADLSGPFAEPTGSGSDADPVLLHRIVVGSLTEPERNQLVSDGACWGSNLVDKANSKPRADLLGKALPDGYTWLVRSNAERTKFTVSILANDSDGREPKLLPAGEFGGTWSESDEVLGARQSWQDQISKWQSGHNDSQALKQAVELDATAVTDDASGPKPLAGVLAQVANKSKMNIVAELGRQRVPRRPKPKPGPISGVLSPFFSERDFAYRFKDDCLVLRTRFPHRIEDEPSGEVLDQIEEAERKDGSGLQKAGALLSPRKFSLLPSLAISVRTLNRPGAYEAFRVLGGLNIAAAREVGFSTLSPALQRSVVALAYDATRGKAPERTELLRALQRPESLSVQRKSDPTVLLLSKLQAYNPPFVLEIWKQ